MEPMARTIWKGHISFGLVQIPVGLYPATKDEDLDFTLLDRRDRSPIGYRKVSKRTGQEVPSGEIVRGYALDEGSYVIVTDDELARFDPESSHSVDLVAFVDGAEIDPRYYVRPYYVAPTQRGGRAYALLRETMRKSGRVGIAKVVLRTRQYIAALMVQGPILVLELLRYPAEIRGIEELDLPDATVEEREMKVAEMLVDTLATNWDPEEYHDEWRGKVLDFIEEKARTGAVAPRGAEEEAPVGEVVDVMALLQRSVERAKQKA